MAEENNLDNGIDQTAETASEISENRSEAYDDREYDLIDSYTFSIDAKGRLFVPVKMREILGSPIYFTRSQNGCLMGFSRRRWMELVKKVSSQPLSKGAVVQRKLGEFGCGLEADNQGRITLPQKLRTAASLDKEVTIIGAITHIEIWNSDLLEKENSDDDNFLSFLGSIGM